MRRVNMNNRRTVFLVCATILAASNLAYSRQHENALTADQAKDHIGETATVCGRVVSTRYAERSNGRPTFLNFDRDYPNQPFTVVIWGADRAKFRTPEDYYRDKNVCVTGVIETYQGRAEILARDPKQIQLR